MTTFAMSALLLSILGLSVGIPHCPMWKEIAPCTCRMDSTKLTTIHCDKMTSYDQVVRLLKGHFAPEDRVSLKISFSKLDDLPYRAFNELNITIENLKLNHDGLGELAGDTFDGLNRVVFFSLADNLLGKVPEHLWKRMPGVRTVDLGRTKIKTLSGSSFKDLPVQCLVLAGNSISQMDQDSFPKEVQRLHIGRNNLKTLNKTLTNLSDLIWLFANSNELTDLEGELPLDAKKLKMIHFSNNKIEKLPQQLKSLTYLESLFFQYNHIQSLDGTLGKARKLVRVVLEHNNIKTLTKEDFTENEILESLILGHNEITSLNNSLLNLKNLNFLNMTFNHLSEFSFQEIVGLQELKSIDLSYNRIKTLIGPATNLVEWNIKLTELKLDHNEIESLDGALSGLPELLRLNLSFNKLRRISPDDLIGLDQLRLLDVSHNYLTTLEETSKTFLPRLEELRASHNYLTILERDFHGLPVLCHADLSNNQIVALGRDLVSKTRCKIGHGVHEGTWDTLKIYLQDNPILCDAALPEIMSSMEINHTRIYGVSHCPPMSEQPVTSKPNAFLGYIPETTPSLPAVIASQPSQDSEPNNQLKPMFKTSAYEAIQLSIPHKNNLEDTATKTQEVDLHQNDQYRMEEPKIDPVKQEKQLTKLASEIEELRSRVEELANQNQILLHQQSNKSTERPPNDGERKP
ncbi:insulin-like growth factor-binding protein complex acid labile subunit [Tribolium madens]|uniref:insulin-like growth factor-binding protein complex acid labile subunit n=1 Tax=Tribolium madens TaxID=41895 RepID=UPI001CF75260|nr:insulin-like growth factor-binding protein complex acid labile subunit [Tribolium madens]